MKRPSSQKEILFKRQRPFSSNNRTPTSPVSSFLRRPTSSKPTSPSFLRTQNRDQSSPNLNILQLIIDNDPTQPSNKDIEGRFKSFLHNSESYFFENKTRPNVKNLFFKYNILYGSNSSNTIKTYLPKMRPISSSVKGYSKYKLKRKNVFIYSDGASGCSNNEDKGFFTNSEIEILFKAKCQDLGILQNERARINFVNSLNLNTVNRILDLRDFNIGVNFIKALQNILIKESKVDEISQIKIGKNPLGDDSLKYIMKIISASKSITHLDLSSANISYKKGKLIFTAIRNHKALISLDLSSKENAYRNRLLSYSMEEAKKMLVHNKYLEYLDLSGNGIKDEGFKLIMEGMTHNEGTIISLNVAHNDISNEGMKYFNLINKTIPLENLYLSDNPIKSEGLIIICKKSNFLRNLTKLHIDNCGINFNGFLFLIQTYGHGSRRLDTLVLDNNKINNKRFEILRELFQNFNVNNLSLKNCDLSELSISYIGDFLKTNEVIKSINLSSNKITDIAFNSYKTLPESTHSLEKIDLSYNLIRDISAIPFVKNLTENFTLREINLSNNQIQNETAAEFLNTLETNKHLVYVNLSLNFIKSEIIDNINVYLKHNKKLTKERYVPELKASIKTNKINRNEYDSFKEQIHLHKKQQKILEHSVKEDELKYDNMKQKFNTKLSNFLSELAKVDNQLNQLNHEIEMNIKEQQNEDNEYQTILKEMEMTLAEMIKENKKLEEEQNKLKKEIAYNKVDYLEEIKRYSKNLEMVKEKKVLAESNINYKKYELEQKKKLLKEVIENNVISPRNFQRNVLRGGSMDKTNRNQTIRNGDSIITNKLKEIILSETPIENKTKSKKKKRGISAKTKKTSGKIKNKKKKKEANNKKANTLNAVRSLQRTFTGFPINNNDINKIYSIGYDTAIKRKDNEQKTQQTTLKLDCNSNSVSKYKETDLTSPKPSMLNTISNN